MSLSPEQHARRQGKIGASFVPSLMAGDEAKLLSEWMRLVEHPDYVPEDLSANWPVQFGSFIESFALDWWERKTGYPLSGRGQWMGHPAYPYVGCTLDAFRMHDQTVIDCKAPGAWRKLDDVIAYYPGQLVVQKACMQAQQAALLIVHGGAEPAEYAVTWGAEYEAEVWRRIEWFWSRVESLQPPCAIPAAKGAVPAVRIVDFTGNNEWGAFAAQWLQNQDGKRLFDAAAKGLKALVEDDVQKAFGHGICCTRSRAGALSIKEGMGK